MADSSPERDEREDMVVTGHEILSDEVVGQGGFLAVRRVRLKNLHADGTRSREYLVDFLVRPKGLDAVVVAAWRRAGDTIEVLLRDGLRPPLRLGRPSTVQIVPDPREYLFFRELCAGIVEKDDRGEAGLLARAALELEEEAGYRVDVARIHRLGGGVFPSAGAMPEKFFLTEVEILPSDVPARAAGDGSPMEDGARIQWMELDAAIAACARGDLEDCKTELGLRRLRDRLGR
jgi:8-oxo-dGTP pyrophosphatase MutT (NUDIX family)